MAKHQRDLKRERTWRRHIAEQRTSGQSIRAYCESHRLRETSFYFWRTEIAKRDREAAAEAKAAPVFVPVAVIDAPAHRARRSTSAWPAGTACVSGPDATALCLPT